MRTQAVNSSFTATAQYAAFSYIVHQLRARPCVLGRTGRDSGRTKFERVHQFGHTDHDFGRTKSKHWHPIGF